MPRNGCCAFHLHSPSLSLTLEPVRSCYGWPAPSLVPFSTSRTLRTRASPSRVPATSQGVTPVRDATNPITITGHQCSTPVALIEPLRPRHIGERVALWARRPRRFEDGSWRVCPSSLSVILAEPAKLLQHIVGPTSLYGTGLWLRVARGLVLYGWPLLVQSTGPLRGQVAPFFALK